MPLFEKACSSACPPYPLPREMLVCQSHPPSRGTHLTRESAPLEPEKAACPGLMTTRQAGLSRHVRTGENKRISILIRPFRERINRKRSGRGFPVCASSTNTTGRGDGMPCPAPPDGIGLPGKPASAILSRGSAGTGGCRQRTTAPRGQHARRPPPHDREQRRLPVAAGARSLSTTARMDHG